jgi:hypothetical protein
VDDDPTDELIELEHALRRAETRFDHEFMERVLADEFGEFGRSGRVYARADTLAVEGETIDAKLRDIEVDLIADDTALVTYVSEVRHEGLDLANRSSLWVRRDGRWQAALPPGHAVQLARVAPFS